MKKFLALLLAAMMLLGMTSAFAEATDTITVMVPPVTGTYLDDIDTWANDFMAEHPEIKVEVIKTSWDDHNSKLNTMANAGEAPDIAEVSYSAIGTYVELGDGELQEGIVWEAAMSAAHYKLDNLTVIVANNGLQIDGSNDEVMSLGDMPAKLRAFGFDLHEIDGHDLDAIEAALGAPVTPGRPKAILAHTVKGKGVSFMEGQVGWHGKAPNEEQRQQALKELED